MRKVAVVTGAAGNGIGRSTALTLAREGYVLVVNYRKNQAPADEICSVIKTQGGEALPIQADIFVQAECERLVAETLAAFNRLDVCVIGPGADWNPEPPDKINPARSLQDVVQEISPIYSLIPRLIPEMQKTGSGRIIAIASNPQLPSPSYSYNVAKNSRINALMGLVAPCWTSRITVNLIAPGPIEPIQTLSAAISQTQQFPDTSIRISPQDIAELIAFLCSTKGRYLTGNIFTFNF